MTKLLCGFFTFISVTTPILMPYSIWGVSLIQILLFIWIILFLVFGNNIKISIKSGLFLLILIINTILINICKKDIDILTLLNYLFFLIASILFSKKYYDIRLGYILYKLISIFSTIYIIAQTFLYYLFGRVLSGYLPFFEIEYERNKQIINNFRPSSIFMEPAGYALFIAMFLLLYLFFKRERNFSFLIFLITGIVLSMSSAGILSVIFIFFLYYLKNIKSIIKKMTITKVLLLFCLSLLLIFILRKVGYVDFISEHLFDSTSNTLGSGIMGRIGNFTDILSLDNGIDLLFGHGFISYENGYLTGILRYIYYYGIIGIIVYYILLVCTFISKSQLSKVIVTISIVWSFFTNNILGVQPIIYYPLLVCDENKNSI